MTTPKPLSKSDEKDLRDFFYTEGGKLFARKKYANRIKVGQEVGCDNQKGYLIVMCRYRLYLVHRVIYFLTYGVWPDKVIDHIDGDKSNNKPENLRALSQGENLRSFALAHSDSKSKYRGVSWNSAKCRWYSEIMFEGKRVRKGGFKSDIDAALHYNEQAIKLGFNREALNIV